MKEKYVVPKEETAYRVFSFLLCMLVCVFVLSAGTPRYDTNDDVTLNNIAVGNYGEQNQSNLVFSNICYGKLITLLYSITGEINWYGFFPLLVSVLCFALIGVVLSKKILTPLSLALPVLFVIFFSEVVLIRVQFTHFAGFFSAVGLFIMYACLFETDVSYRILNVFGVLIAILGCWLRRDAFLSVAAIVLVCCLIKIIQRKFWKIKISELIKYASPFLILLVLVLISEFINAGVYQGNEEWRFWTEYNTYRASLLDYPLPNYETYASEYQALGIDQLDFEMLCTWNYADLNKFSLDTMEKLCQLQSQVKGESFQLAQVLKQYIVDLKNFFVDNPSFVLIVAFGISALFWKASHIWLLFPLGVLAAELFYLSFSGRFVFRSHLGLWVAIALIICDSVLEKNDNQEGSNRNAKVLFRQTAGLMVGIFVMAMPWMYTIYSEGEQTTKEIKEKLGNYTWRETLAQDKESLYVQETLFGGIPGSLTALGDVPLFYHNLYCLGGWTCPAPLEQYLLESYDISEEGIMHGLFSDEKNVYYIETNEENRRDRLLSYIRKEYGVNVYAERVDIIDNISVYRFYVDDTANKSDPDLVENVYNLDKADKNLDIRYKLEMSATGDKHIITGWCNVDEIDPYKQNVWLKVTSAETDESRYYRSIKQVVPELATLFENQHYAASGVMWIIDENVLNLEQGDVIELYIESNGFSASTNITNKIDIQ